MIINGGSRSARTYWTKHLQRADTNEQVRVIELRGLAGATIDEALLDMEIMALGTRCKNFMYHANINPCADEALTPEQWAEAVDRLEQNLGYDGLPRVVVEHEKAGRTHQHIIWSRIDPERMTARSDSLTARIHEQTSRELKVTFDLERGKSVLVPDRDFERPERRPQSWESFRGQESGITPEQVATQVRELYAQAEHGQAFAHALDEAGYLLCQGDKRGYVILDQAGDVHSLGRRAGVKAAELRAFMQDVPLASLPTVTEARAQWRDRDHSPAVDQELDRAEAQERQQPPEAKSIEREPQRDERPILLTPAREEAPQAPTVKEAVQDIGDMAGRATGIAGNMLGGIIRIAEPLLGALADFITGTPSYPSTPQRETPPAPPAREPDSAERLRDQARTLPLETPTLDPQTETIRRFSPLALSPEKEANIQRLLESQARARRRDNERGGDDRER